MTQDITLSQNKEYRNWVKELKQRYLSWDMTLLTSNMPTLMAPDSIKR